MNKLARLFDRKIGSIRNRSLTVAALIGAATVRERCTAQALHHAVEDLARAAVGDD
jgi:hypothetical protein